MNARTYPPAVRRRRAVATATVVLTLAALPAAADERRELEQLRATTLGLIEALVAQGLLTRERADALLRQAAASAAAPRPASAAPDPAAPAQAAAVPWGTPPDAVDPRPANVIRVPYVPETVKAEIRAQIQNDVLAIAREERWADPRALPSWLRGLTFAADARVRAELADFAEPQYAPGETDPCRITGGNLPAECYRTQAASPAWAPDLTNTTEDRQRLSLRARFGLEARVGDDTAFGLRVTTGTTNSPTSSSVTLGSGFNKQPIVIDRAFVRWEPSFDLRVFAGRMANPFYGSDLLWPDDLNLDGVALQGERNVAAGAFVFGTIGAFPLEEFNIDSRDKWMFGLQVGGEYAFDDGSSVRLGVAIYDFDNAEGVRETQPPPTGARAGTVPYLTSQYPTSVRLKGNTLINLNDPTSVDAAPTWGLASKFRPLNVTAQYGWRAGDPLLLTAQVDWVKNGAFDLADIERRAGVALPGLAAFTEGTQLRLTANHAPLGERGEWRAFLALRKFERDAWIDGFTDTTWHLGGTNYRGWQLGGSWAFDRRSTLDLRVTSTRNLDDGTLSLSSAPLRIDVIQLDVNTRF
ncbi:MAG: putative porin [Rubrivivax sp.]|nr:putative porin [Rubrivivax sp.]